MGLLFCGRLAPPPVRHFPPVSPIPLSGGSEFISLRGTNNETTRHMNRQVCRKGRWYARGRGTDIATRHLRVDIAFIDDHSIIWTNDEGINEDMLLHVFKDVCGPVHMVDECHTSLQSLSIPALSVICPQQMRQEGSISGENLLSR
jgi:hypothetical protein